MKVLRALIITSLFLHSLAFSTQASSQNMEERFQDMFLTAGYCTAFGAALGTALLAFDTDPSQHLKKVAIGASLGFISGSALGSYIVFSPMFVAEANPANQGTLLAAHTRLPSRGVVLRPTWNHRTSSLMSLEGGLTLLQF